MMQLSRRVSVESRPVGLPAMLVIIIGWGAVGMVMIAGSLIQGWGPAPSLIGFPDVVEGVAGAFILAAATCELLAAREWEHPDSRWRLEMVGCILGFGGWATHSIMCAVNQPAWMVPYLIGASFAAGAAVRAVQVWRHARQVRAEGAA